MNLSPAAAAAAAAAAQAAQAATQNQAQFSSPATATPSNATFVNPMLTAGIKPAPNVAALASAAAAAKNNNMFTFNANSNNPSNLPNANNQTANTGGVMPNNNISMPSTVPAPKPSAPSLDHDGVNRVLTKRKIQELVTQIDPSERLEPEVEDVCNEMIKERGDN